MRTAEALISREPGQTLLVGLAGLVIVPVIAILAMITIIGAPLGLAILLGGMAGRRLCGLSRGRHLDRRMADRSRQPEARERPYLAAVVGLVTLQILSIIPFLGAIASLFGFGAVLLMGWRTFRQPSAAQPLVEPCGDPGDGRLILEDPDQPAGASAAGAPAARVRSHAITSSMIAGPSGSLWSSWRRPG